MSLIKYNPRTARSLSFNSAFDNFFNDFFTTPPSNEKSFVPQVDIAETDKAFEIAFVVPGVNKGDFNIDLQDGKLTVSGERKLKEEKSEKNFRSVESYHGSFSRSFYLPDSVVEDKVSAKYENGILNITVPKDEKKVLKKNIEVK